MSDNLPSIKILDEQDFSALEKLLRQVPLQGDPRVKVYQHAQIIPKKYRLTDLSPTSLYVLHRQLEQQRTMYRYLQTHGRNLFELKGILDYEQSGKTYRLAPPIIERYVEPTTGKEVSVIIDGLHRLWVARELGHDEVWVIEVSELPKALPPTPLPVAWQDVKVRDTVPPTPQKRRYRYASPESFPDMKSVTDVPVTALNYLYFLYRDYASLGSEGIRK